MYTYLIKYDKENLTFLLFLIKKTEHKLSEEVNLLINKWILSFKCFFKGSHVYLLCLTNLQCVGILQIEQLKFSPNNNLKKLTCF